MHKLTPKEFEKAIRQGHGRAFLYVQSYGDEEVRELLLNAILSNLVYDNQCEGSRAKWLFSILKNTNNITYYSNGLISNLTHLDDFWDIYQSLDLLLEFAKCGNTEAKQAIYNKFNNLALNASWLGGEQIIELDAIDGFIYVAQKIGQRMREDENVWEDDYLLTIVEEKFGEEKVQSVIAQKSIDSEDLKIYFEKLIRSEKVKQSSSKENRAEKIRKRYPLTKILDDIENARDEFGYRYALFGKYCSIQDLNIIFAKLLQEERKPQLIRLIQVFSKRELPELPAKILKLARSTDDDLQFVSILALSNLRHHEVYKLGKSILQEESWEKATLGLRLLIRNYHNGDERLIQNCLERVCVDSDRVKIHKIGCDLIHIYQKNQQPESNDILMWIYENSPCMVCRYDAVKLLLTSEGLPKHILSECLVDGYKQIREIASQ